MAGERESSLPMSVLSFSQVLQSQIDDSLPYGLMKRILRTLKATHPRYPRRHPSQNHHIFSLSQTQYPSSACITPAVPVPSPTASHLLIKTDTKAARALDFTTGSYPPSLPSSQATPIRCSPPSRLRRKRRHSKRPLVPSSSLNQPSFVDSPLNHTISVEAEQPPSKKLKTDHNVPTANVVGKQINVLLDELAAAVPGHAVTWVSLRSQLVIKDSVFEMFCSSMDRIFDDDDPLTTEISTMSQGSRGCVFYSNTFWEGAWRDFWEDYQRRTTEKSYNSSTRKYQSSNSTLLPRNLEKSSFSPPQ